MSEHSILGPSSAVKWGNCNASPFMEKNIPNKDSEDAALGTAQHECAAFCLMESEDYPASNCIGKKFHGIKITREMADYVQIYIDQIRELSKGHDLFVEQRLPIERITLEKDGFGTGDAIIIQDKVLCVSDAKFGYGKVFAKDNPQLMLYALGALELLGHLYSIESVVLRIHQPRIDHYDEAECSLEQLKAFADSLRVKVPRIWALFTGEIEIDPEIDFAPSHKTCQWCRAKASCSAAVNNALSIASNDFVDISKDPTLKLDAALQKIQFLNNQELSWLLQNADTLEAIAKAARARAELELFAGREVPGFKLVQGKKSNRKWEDEEAVAKAMLAAGLTDKDIYTKDIISPPAVDKLLKKKKPDEWKKINDLSIQSDGKPSVAASTDPRPALSITDVSDDFDVIENKS